MKNDSITNWKCTAAIANTVVLVPKDTLPGGPASIVLTFTEPRFAAEYGIGKVYEFDLPMHPQTVGSR